MNQDCFTLILTLDTASEPQKSVIVNIRCIRYIGFSTGAIILTIELNTYIQNIGFSTEAIILII